MKSKKFFLFISLVITFWSLHFNTISAKEVKEKSTIKADQMETIPNKKAIYATGDVELIKGQKIFHAEKIIYNQQDKTIEAEGNIKIDDATGNNFFADKSKLTDDANKGDFYDAGIIFENGSSITSPHITRESENIFWLKKPRYFLCPTDLNFDLSYEEILEQTLNKKRTLFSIKSSTLKIDQSESELTFKHAIIKVWGVPIFYLPYLKTDHPFRDKQTGFEAPELRHNTYYDYGLFLPYYIRISKSQNLRLKPGVFEESNNMLEAYYNNDFKKDGFLRFKGSVINDNDASQEILNTRGISEFNEGKYKDMRGYGEMETSYQFNDFWSTYAFGTMVSDDYVLRDYYQNYTAHLKSNVDLDRINKRNNNLLKIKTLFYQEIREEILDATEQTPQYIPLVDSHLETDLLAKKKLKLTFNLDSNFTAIHRTTGLNYYRTTLTPNLENKFIASGNVFKTKLLLRNDFYHLEENYKQSDSDRYQRDEVRSIPGFEFQWSLPLIDRVGNNVLIIEPIVKYMADLDQENFEGKIPNEDSLSAEISYANIFSHNRYGGYDRVEYGNRVSYGIKSGLYSQKYGALNFILAQGYRDNNDGDNTFQIRGFSEDVSDVVGKISYDTKKIFDIYYRFRLDRTNFTGKSNEVTGNFQFKRFRLFTTYTMLKAEGNDTERQEQMLYGGELYFLNKWTLSASATTDFVNKNATIETKAGIHYDGKCTSFRVDVIENNPRDLKSERSIRFNFLVKTSLF